MSAARIPVAAADAPPGAERARARITGASGLAPASSPMSSGGIARSFVVGGFGADFHRVGAYLLLAEEFILILGKVATIIDSYG